jgi:hypothetical protein
MKKLLAILLFLIAFASQAQINFFGGIGLRVNDSTTYRASAAVTNGHSNGYRDIYFNNQATTKHWDIWNGSSYNHVFSFGSSGGGGGTWGSIIGTLSAQTDLQNALDGKVPLTFSGNTTIATGGFDLRLQGTGTQIPTLALDAPNNIRKAIVFRTGNVERWQIHTENNETGSGNTGTDFHIERYDDAGAQIDAPFGIGRTDGVAFFNKAPVITTAPAASANNTQVPPTSWVQTEINARIAASITNGVTTSAPNQDQVFDALALKADLSRSEVYTIPFTDEITPITATTAKRTFHWPYANTTITGIWVGLTTAQTSGSIFTVDVNEGGTTILSTKITVDNTETHSSTAATGPVISDTSIAQWSIITIDVDQIGDSTAKGGKLYIQFTRP